jgi:peptidoglycan-N-acetylglucosamine deacetylase
VDRVPAARPAPRLRAAVAATLLGLTALMLVAPPPADAGTPSLVRHGSRSQPVVALTFDDAWSFSNTQRIFDILQRRKVKATFFPYARAVMGAKPLWRRIAAAGYPIANHTYNHANLTRLSPARIRWELTTARETIEKITGVPMLRVYRPPGGASNATVLREAAAVGFATSVLWDVSAADTSRHGSWSTVRRRALAGRNGSIVLMHCGPAATPAILNAVITGYQRRGFRFVTIPELLGPKIAPWPAGSPGPTATPSPSASPSPGTSAAPSEKPTSPPLPPWEMSTTGASPTPPPFPPWELPTPTPIPSPSLAPPLALPGLDPWGTWEEASGLNPPAAVTAEGRGPPGPLAAPSRAPSRSRTAP